MRAATPICRQHVRTARVNTWLFRADLFYRIRQRVKSLPFASFGTTIPVWVVGHNTLCQPPDGAWKRGSSHVLIAVMSKRSSHCSAFHPLDWANEVLVQTQDQVDREQYVFDAIERLDTAAEIFAVNGHNDQVRLAAAYRPQLLLARADFGSTVTASIKVFDDQTFPAPLRIRAGIAAMLAIGQTLQSQDARAFVASFERLCKATSLDEDVLAGLAAVGRNRIYSALSEAGIASALKNRTESPPIRSRESLRALAADVARDLEVAWRASGIPRLRRADLPATRAWALCIADEQVDVDAAFAAVRTSNPLSWPLTVLLMEGQLHCWRGDQGRAIAVLTRAIERAKKGQVLHKEAIAHFEIAQAYAFNRQFDRACTHMLHYCRILQTNLEQSNVHVVSVISPRTARSASGHGLHLPAGRVHHMQAEPPYLKRACRFVEQHLHESLSMHDIATASGASRRSLELAFRKLRGVSPIEFLKITRLDQASKLLSSTDWSIWEVREAVGYRRASAFSIDFRKRFGISPMAARKHARARTEGG